MHVGAGMEAKCRRIMIDLALIATTYDKNDKNGPFIKYLGSRGIWCKTKEWRGCTFFLSSPMFGAQKIEGINLWIDRY